MQITAPRTTATPTRAYHLAAHDLNKLARRRTALLRALDGAKTKREPARSIYITLAGDWLQLLDGLASAW